MPVMQIRDAQGRAIVRETIPDGGKAPKLPEGWSIEPADGTPLWRPASAISRRQFAQALAVEGTITEAESLAWSEQRSLPQALAAVVDILEPAARYQARMLLSAETYERDHPLVAQLALALGRDDAALDGLWALAAAL